MSIAVSPLGTLVSDEDSPTFEMVRIKLKAGCEVRPGTLVRIPIRRNGTDATLIARIRSAYEHNPNERPEDINVRETLGMLPNYPGEEDSTTIYRIVEADLVEEIVDGTLTSPQTLPASGALVFAATELEIVQALGLVGGNDSKMGLHIGQTVTGNPVPIRLKRDVIQRHMFICGTTGSGKSYAMGVIAEELIEQHLPVVFIDTQDEYSKLVVKKGGRVVEPGKDFSIRISSLTESELLDLMPAAMQKSPLQMDVVGKAFGELQTGLRNQDYPKFGMKELLEKIEAVAPELSSKPSDVPRLVDTTMRRARTLEKHKVFGDGLMVADWRRYLYPCVAINCKHLTTQQLQSVATAVLRELQDLRLRNWIPPYVAVIDEAHLFIPEGDGSPCKQIIREGVRIGRHHGIAMILMTQSPVDIDKRAIRQCNTRLVFALEPDQLDAIRGVKADASEEMLRSLPKLPRGTCLLSGTYESVRHTIPVRIRPQRTIDAVGGQAPDIFAEMEKAWIPAIDKLKDRGKHHAAQAAS